MILSINGQSVRDEEHEEIVGYIAQCLSMRLVVLFEDCAQKIDLFARSIKLKVRPLPPCLWFRQLVSQKFYAKCFF